jgi:hypothetical protein
VQVHLILVVLALIAGIAAPAVRQSIYLLSIGIVLLAIAMLLGGIHG